MDDDAGLICVCSFYGRLIWPEAAKMSDCHFCVCWWDGGEVRRTYLPDRPGADAYARARHGIVVMLVPSQPWPTKEQVMAACAGNSVQPPAHRTPPHL